MKSYSYLLSVLFGLFLIPLFLITSVEIVVYYLPDFFETEYTKYNVTEKVDMEMTDLLSLTDQMMSYLRGDREELQVTTLIGGEELEFFNEREIAHMEDVRNLFVGALALRRLLFIGALLCLLLLLLSRAAISHVLPLGIEIGTGLFFLILAGLTLVISTDFTRYFTIFHQLFFDNDLWILDSRTDRLINILPEGFFIDTALTIGIVFGGFLLLLFFGCLLFSFLSRRVHKKSSAILSLLLTLCLCLSSSLSVSATEITTLSADVADPEISAEAAILIDAKTGTILYSKNADTAYYPASITKVLTALVVLENCDDLNDIVTFSYAAVYGIDSDSSKIAAYQGEELTVEQALYGLLLKSGNDCAVALAEYIAGSEEAFCELMNAKAAELGCTGSHFVNSHGLTDEDHYTTAHDMALIMQAAIQNETFLIIDSTYSYTVTSTNLRPEGFDTWYMSNRMINSYSSDYYEGVISGKTGYTDEAVNTLVTYAKRGDTELICVVMKCSSTHYSDTATLYDYGFDNYTSYNMAETVSSYTLAGTGFFSSLSEAISSSSLSIVQGEDSWIILPNSVSVEEITAELDYTITAESASSVIARILYYYEGLAIGESSLILDASALFPEEVVTEEDEADASNAAFCVALYSESSGSDSFSIWMGAGVLLLLLFLVQLFLYFTPSRRRRREARRRRKSYLSHRRKSR